MTARPDRRRLDGDVEERILWQELSRSTPPTKWPGIARKLLRNDATTGARTVLLKFDANTRLPRHMHPAGAEVFVLEGRVRFEETWYDAGFYLYSPPGSADDVFTDTGAILFVALPQPHVDLE